MALRGFLQGAKWRSACVFRYIDDHAAPEISPKDELVALMKYMVGHNAAHIDELAELAKQLDTIGETNAYDRIRNAVELFRHGNEHLAEVLKDLQ